MTVTEAEMLEYAQEAYEARRRKPKTKAAEWRLHASAAKLCYQRERVDPSFRFFSPGGEGARTPQRAAIAKLLGQNRRGVLDIWLFRILPLRVNVVEFKNPGGKLTAEQSDWYCWLERGDVTCYLCTDLEYFKSILARF